MKLIIAGGRDFSNSDLMNEKLDYLLSNTPQNEIEIVSGCAKGADSMGERYAEIMGYAVKQFPANWDRDGKAAGPIRNREMAEYATHLIAFHDGVSRGTANMIQVAKELGLKVRVVRY